MSKPNSQSQQGRQPIDVLNERRSNYVDSNWATGWWHKMRFERARKKFDASKINQRVAEATEAANRRAVKLEIGGIQ